MSSSYWARRTRRHLLLGGASAVLAIAVYAVADDKAMVSFKASMAFGYASLALLALSLAIGPWRVLRGRPNPVSSDLRRDVGIWCALLALAHVATGLAVHMGGRAWLYFIAPPERRHLIPLRLDGFGLANYTGLVATIILSLLLAISNDRALRRLGTHRWKSVQRLNYLAAALVALHGVVYAYIDKRSIGFIVLLLVLVAIAAALQLAGMRRAHAIAPRAAPASALPDGTPGDLPGAR